MRKFTIFSKIDFLQISAKMFLKTSLQTISFYIISYSQASLFRFHKKIPYLNMDSKFVGRLWFAFVFYFIIYIPASWQFIKLQRIFDYLYCFCVTPYMFYLFEWVLDFENTLIPFIKRNYTCGLYDCVFHIFFIRR